MLQSTKLTLDRVLAKAGAEEPLSPADTEFLLGLESKEDLGRLFETARALRERHFGNRVFLYGFVYFSTWCGNSCAFCYFRSANHLSRRYRKSTGETVAIARSLAASGVHLIDLTMGEDPLFHREAGGPEALAALVRAVKEEAGLPVMISPGVAFRPMLEALAGAGADWYACYQETHNRDLFARLRLGQDYDARMESKRQARAAGLLVEEGIMAGVGETAADLASSVEAMRELQAHQVRVMSFVPQEGSIMSGWPSPDRRRELAAIAVLRLAFPGRLIPASLDVDGLAGLKGRMLAGANVVTSLIPPDTGLAGVAQSEMDIDEGLRSAREVLPVLEEMGLQAATPEEYRCWVDRVRALLARENAEAAPCS